MQHIIKHALVCKASSIYLCSKIIIGRYIFGINGIRTQVNISEEGSGFDDVKIDRKYTYIYLINNNSVEIYFGIISIYLKVHSIT